MFKIKLLKEYTYTTICDIDFNVLVDFDYEDEVLLYSLKYEDHNYNTGDFLINFAKKLDEETLNKEIKSFMLNYIQSEVSCYIDDNDYNEWTIKTTESGLKLANEKANKWFAWDAYDDDDYEIIIYKIIECLDFDNQH